MCVQNGCYVDCRGSLGSFGEMEIFGSLCLLHVIIVFVNLLLYC